MAPIDRQAEIEREREHQLSSTLTFTVGKETKPLPISYYSLKN